MLPLHWPHDFSPAINRTWCWGRGFGREYHRVVAHISGQLEARESPPETVWGTEPTRRSIAPRICHRIQELFEWPNDHFLPDDPIDILFLAPWDDLEIVELIMQTEEDFGIDIPDREAESWRVLSDVMNTVADKLCKP